MLCLRIPAVGNFLLVLVVIAVALWMNPRQGAAQREPKRFSVEDDIALNQFSGSSENYAGVNFSPDRRYFFVMTDRGRLDINKAESSLRVYRVGDIANFLLHSERAVEPAPRWSVARSTYKYGPIFDNARWVRDSSGVAFLAKTPSGNNQLLLANVHDGTVHELTPENLDVTAFDVRSRNNYVYSVLSATILERAEEGRRAAFINGTGMSLPDLLFPAEDTRKLTLHDLSDVWAVVDGKRFRVIDQTSRQPISIHRSGQDALALSPDAHSIVTALTVRDVPTEWASWFPARLPAFSYRTAAGRRNERALNGYFDLSAYVLIDLLTGHTTALVRAPIGFPLGWGPAARADWSQDGQSVLLPNTFLPPPTSGVNSPTDMPCVAVTDLVGGDLRCVDGHGGKPGEEWRRVVDAQFSRGSKNTVKVMYSGRRNSLLQLNFSRRTDGSWTIAAEPEPNQPDDTVDVSIDEGVSAPPLLVAHDKRANISQVIWDPNPQLKDIRLGNASVLKWKDATGRDWIGGLYKPPDYAPGKRYPLVIQTHAFTSQQFMPSGSYPTVFAAQELASVGFVVLQAENCPQRGTSEEGPCQVAGYEAAVERLSGEGLVDPDRLGIVGFSRGCYYVLDALTTSRLKFKAALIADGVTFGYSQYIESSDLTDNTFAHDANIVIGVSPFGAGIKRWLQSSPLFNMDRVATPVEVLATSLGTSILGVWEPYATLRYLHKPVDLVIINSEEHVFTNPANRLISQGNTVDWFRFWLQAEEDHNPAKAEQYGRWQELRRLHFENEKSGPHQ